jgi:hypothetical protein
MVDASRSEGRRVTSEDRSIFLASPCYAGLAHALYMRSLLALRPACAARRIGLHVELGGGEALIGRARAAMLAKFLAGQATHLLFVDADIGFSPQAVFRLLDAGLDVIGGAYPTKAQDPARPLAYEFEPLPGQESAASGRRQVASVGAGFLLVSRTAARRIADGYPTLRASLGDMHELGVAEAAMVFESFTDPATGRYLADHQAFCHRWRALGGEVWIDLAAGLSHVGVVTYPVETASAGA